MVSRLTSKVGWSEGGKFALNIDSYRGDREGGALDRVKNSFEASTDVIGKTEGVSTERKKIQRYGSGV
jgi:hypothetical protein